MLIFRHISFLTASIESKFAKYRKSDQLKISNNKYINQECLIPTLNEWDPKIKDMFKKVPAYSDCAKSEPFTYVINSEIFFNASVNQTFFKGEYPI